MRRLPHGVGTVLGDGGAGLSAGERQRLALARAFVRDAPLLVLDEPTASLDAETEADVLDAVRRLTDGRTALVVAHRPALAALADRVVHLPDAARSGMSGTVFEPAPIGRPRSGALWASPAWRRAAGPGLRSWAPGPSARRSP